VEIREPKGFSETSEEELKKLTDILVNRYGWSSFSMGLASSGNLSFSFLVAGWREMLIVKIDVNNQVHV
jgi:hypothetical protein